MIHYFKNSRGLATFEIIFEGSNVEKSHELGCAHLLEHLVCYNIKQFEDDFELDGIEFNAETAPTFTRYYIRGLDERVQKWAQQFYNAIVTKPLQASEKEFEEEKRIVIQEWHDYMNNPDAILLLNFYLKYYKTPRTIGTLKALNEIAFTKFKEMYHNHFCQPLYCLIENSGKWEVTDWAPYKMHHDSLIEFNLENKVKYLPKEKGINTSLMLVSQPIDSDVTEHYVINCMLVDGLHSPLMKELRENRQLIYSMQGHLEMVNPFLTHSLFATSSLKQNKDKIWKSFKKVINSRDWLTESKFNQTVQRNIIENEIQERLGQNSPLDYFLDPQSELINKEIKTVSFKKVKDLVEKKYSDKFFIMLD